ncbi:MAG: hypothetical protein JSV68_14810 [Anaerolineaceae bacterium]|nr:MAG: hypothetical protein JSV68_14810 [Anaerolineaceae bacterium]
MNSRERFQQTMCYGRPDRVPYFEEGIRDDVLRVWRAQGMSADRTLYQMFPIDRRHEIAPELEPRPSPESWPDSISELTELRQKLDPDDPGRLPSDWIEGMRAANARGDVVMFRVHRGFFQSLGVFDWDRFEELMYLLIDDPAFVQEAMAIVGDFSVRLAKRVLKEVRVDAAIFSEPIGGNSGPLISPQMYEELVLPSYEPVLSVLRQHGVETIIFRTYANARVLVPSVLKWGFNCLWACEVNLEAMDYHDLRREFGRELRLIGGIDVDVLRHDKETIRREVEEKVPPLLADGGYVPLADGRIRAEVPFENYVYYRGLLEEVIHS